MERTPPDRTSRGNNPTVDEMVENPFTYIPRITMNTHAQTIPAGHITHPIGPNGYSTRDDIVRLI